MPCHSAGRIVDALRGRGTRRPRRVTPPSNFRADGGRGLAVAGGVHFASGRTSMFARTMVIVLHAALRGWPGPIWYLPSTTLLPHVVHGHRFHDVARIWRPAQLPKKLLTTLESSRPTAGAAADLECERLGSRRDDPFGAADALRAVVADVPWRVRVPCIVDFMNHMSRGSPASGALCIFFELAVTVARGHVRVVSPHDARPPEQEMHELPPVDDPILTGGASVRGGALITVSIRCLSAASRQIRQVIAVA